jgi:drug/metabolite transporter (DMT)-like permease
VTIAGVFLYARAVSLLGASRAAAFGALVPALSAVFAVPLLGEWPSRPAWAGIILISTGVHFASGAPLPGAERRPAVRRRCAQRGGMPGI